MVAWSNFKGIQSGSAQSVASSLSSVRQQEIEENREYVKLLLKAAALLGRQGLSFRGHKEDDNALNSGNFIETLELIAESNPSLKKKLDRRYGHYTSPQYQNDLISVIGTHIKHTICTEAQSAQFFSVMVDETKDLLKKEQLAILVRYFSEGVVKERVIGTYHMEKVDVASLVDFIYKEIEQSGLIWSNCVAQCYDGASVMSGCFSGVQVQLRDKIPQAVSVAKVKLCYGSLLAVLHKVEESSDSEAAAEASGLYKQLLSIKFVVNLHVAEQVLKVTNSLSDQLQAK
ncbi:zinc finger MYM-type protein 1-like [Macrobrachium rosenbergii]|uniref:zinc finger MYM-type protein 1-like n=1 Tax=Macrobrachium rosenbergii TaxID=79674 RepID=UPI0034D7B7D3